jgi:hypothetical protein
VDGYVYNKDEEPKIMVTGKWNVSLSCQPCDVEGEPLPGTELKEVSDFLSMCAFVRSVEIQLTSNLLSCYLSDVCLLQNATTL